jgi:hypothetical protein
MENYAPLPNSIYFPFFPLPLASSLRMQIFGQRLQQSPAAKGSSLPLAYYLSNSSVTSNSLLSTLPPIDPNTTKLSGYTFFESLQIPDGFPLLSTFLLGGIDPNSRTTDGLDNTALHITAKAGNTLATQFLKDNGADINALNSRRQTPIMIAAMFNQVDMIKLLIHHHADVSAVDDEGHTVAFYAIKNSLTLHSLSAAVDISQATKAELLLHHACRSPGARFTVFYLSEFAAADVNVLDSERRTPLHYAALSGDLDTVKALLSKGADTRAVDANGKTPAGQPKVLPAIASFISAYEAETSNTNRERRLAPDFSNLSQIDAAQVRHFLVAFTVPNIFIWIGSTMNGFFGFLCLMIASFGFTQVASFGMKQPRRSMATAGWFSGALAFGSFVLVDRVFPTFKMYHEDSWAPFWWWVATAAMFYCYARAVLADPGCVLSTQEGRRAIYEAVATGGEAQIEALHLDTTAMVRKPLRSKHCGKTNQCVYRFDHYCVWTGNAIGGGNHRHFVWYCIFQFFSQILVSYTTLSYLLNDYPLSKHIALDSFWDRFGFFYTDENTLVTFILVFYNTFVFLFVASVVFTQLWYASRNVTSNEVWFPERYRWMMKLGSRAYSLFDQGPRRNLVDFFWSGNLMADIFVNPEMSEHLQKKCREHAAREKTRIRNMEARLGRNFEQGPIHIHSGEGGSQGGSSPQKQLPAISEGPISAAAAAAASGANGSGAFNFQSALTLLPPDKQTEMNVVQSMLQQMIRANSTQGVGVPETIPEGRRDALLHQAKVMFQHYHQAMNLVQQQQSQQAVQLLTGNLPGGVSAAAPVPVVGMTGGGSTSSAAAPAPSGSRKND